MEPRPQAAPFADDTAAPIHSPPGPDIARALARLCPPGPARGSGQRDHPPDSEAVSGLRGAAIDQLLYHGRGDELIDWSLARGGAADRTPLGTWAADGAARYPAAIALELVLARLASLDDGSPAAAAGWASARALADEPSTALLERVASRRGLGPGALERDAYRHDRPGHELVPLLEALSRRFGHLLAVHWGWPAARALLARDELDALHFERLDAVTGLEGAGGRRGWAWQRRPRRDLGRGATVLALDANRIIIDWPQRLAAPGGPYRAAALLEALPAWIEYLEALRLTDALLARRQARAVVRVGQVLAPSLRAETRDRAVAAAAQRLEAGDRRHQEPAASAGSAARRSGARLSASWPRASAAGKREPP